MPSRDHDQLFTKENTVGRMFYNRITSLSQKNYVSNYQDGDWTWITWGQYGKMVREIAHGLLALDFKPGQVAGILSQTRLEWGLSDQAIMSIGCITVTVYPTLLAQDTAYILGHAQARLVFIEDVQQLKKIQEHKQDLPGLEYLVLLSGKPKKRQKNVLTLDELRELGQKHLAKHPDLWRERIAAIKPEDLATLVYTSGTTGPPKGAMISQANFIETCRALEKLDLVNKNDHAISYLPLCHIYERISTYMYGIYSGCTCGIARGMETLIEDIGIIRPTVMVGVPRVYEKIHAGILMNLRNQSPTAQKIFRWALAAGKEATACRQAGKPLTLQLRLSLALAEQLVFNKIKARFGGRLRCLVSAAAPIAQEILDFFDALGIPIVEGYGMTECTGPATLANLETMRIGYVGRALTCCQIKLADDGEILVKGQNVFMGYHKNPESTAESLVDQWLHTGDVGELTQDGYLRITDRKKDIIITAGGKNIAPQNIENFIKLDRYIAEVVVIGDRRKYLSALIAVDDEAVSAWARKNDVSYSPETVTESPQIRDLISQRIDDFNRKLARFEGIKKFRIVPRQFTIEGGELTPTMKIKRKVVLKKYADLIDEMYEE